MTLNSQTQRATVLRTIMFKDVFNKDLTFILQSFRGVITEAFGGFL